MNEQIYQHEYILSVRKQTYVEIIEPGEDRRILSLKIACGEKPLVEWEGVAKDAPKNDVEGGTTADTLVASSIHLAARYHMGKNVP
jgi:hypothetical protein